MKVRFEWWGNGTYKGRRVVSEGMWEAMKNYRWKGDIIIRFIEYVNE